MRAARAAPLAFVPFAVVVVLATGAWLPDPMATHWSFAGEADSHLSPVVFLALMVAVWVGIWALHGTQQTSLVGSYATFGLLLAAFLLVVVVNAGAATWRDAHLDWRGIGVIAAGAGLGALLGRWLSGRLLDT